MKIFKSLFVFFICAFSLTALAGSMPPVDQSNESLGCEKCSLSYKGGLLSASIVRLNDVYYLKLLRNNKADVILKIPEDAGDIKDVRSWGDKVVVVGWVGGSAYSITIISSFTDSIVDSFLGFAPSFSPDSKYIAFIKFYTMHFLAGVEDQYRLYDLSKSPQSNRPNSLKLEDDVGMPLTDSVLRQNYDVQEDEIHRFSGPELLWISSDKVIFSDIYRKSLSIKSADLSNGSDHIAFMNYAIPNDECPNDCEFTRINRIVVNAKDGKYLIEMTNSLKPGKPKMLTLPLCWRALKIDHLCSLKIDQGMGPRGLPLGVVFDSTV